MADENTEERQLIRLEDFDPEQMSLVQQQRAEQLYQQLGLDPVVDAILREFPESLSGMDKVADRLFGPYDIKGRAEAVAKVTALVTFAALSAQYGEEAAKLHSQITALEGDRDQVRTHYDSLVQKVADIVGGDYDELKANYGELVDKLSDVEHLRSQLTALNEERAQLAERMATVLGGDHEDLKTNYGRLIERFSEVESLREQVATLQREKAELEERYQKETAAMADEHSREKTALSSQIAALDSRREGLESEREALTSELAQLKEEHTQLTQAHAALTKDHNGLSRAAKRIAGAVRYDDIKAAMGDELYSFVLKDSKVPDVVIDGVGKFIDFRKYLGMAAERGAREAGKQAEEALAKALATPRQDTDK